MIILEFWEDGNLRGRLIRVQGVLFGKGVKFEDFLGILRRGRMIEEVGGLYNWFGFFLIVRSVQIFCYCIVVYFGGICFNFVFWFSVNQ